MDIYTDIAKGLSPEGRENLARFHAAAKEHKKLPAPLNTLPPGLLHCSLEGGEVVGTLTPFGTRVALAAEALTQSGEEAA